jgi:hypothetical protein
MLHIASRNLSVPPTRTACAVYQHASGEALCYIMATVLRQNRCFTGLLVTTLLVCPYLDIDGFS